MKNLSLTTYQNGIKLLGRDFNKVITDPTPKKLRQEQNFLNTRLQSLVKTKPHLSSGWILKVETI